MAGGTEDSRFSSCETPPNVDAVLREVAESGLDGTVDSLAAERREGDSVAGSGKSVQVSVSFFQEILLDVRGSG